MKKTYITGHNVLVELITSEQKTTGGIILAGTSESKDEALLRGTVVNKGPGFLLPFPKTVENEIDILLDNATAVPQYLHLDIQIGDTAYFPKDSGEPIILDGKVYHIIPYPAIKAFLREER